MPRNKNTIRLSERDDGDECLSISKSHIRSWFEIFRKAGVFSIAIKHEDECCTEKISKEGYINLWSISDIAKYEIRKVTRGI